MTDVLDIVGLGLNALPGFLQIGESQRRAENPPVVGRQTGREGAVTSFQGGEVPSGGFELSPFLQGQINSLEAPAATRRGGLFNLFQVSNPDFEAFQSGIGRAQEIASGNITESQAQELQQILREAGKDELAGEIAFQFTQQTGGFNVDPGVRDILQAGISDIQTARGIAERDKLRKLQSLGITQSIRTELLPQLREDTTAGFLEARRDEQIAENRAIGALRSGALPAIAPVIQAQRLRDEITTRLEDDSVAKLESQRVALDRRHDNQLKSARAQLEQQFPGNPGLVESQLNQIRSSQFQELGTLQNGLIADFARLESDIDAQTAGFVQQSTLAAAGQLVNLSTLEAQTRDVFSRMRNQNNMSKINNDMSITMLDRANRSQESELLRSWNELFVPAQELVNQIFGINQMIESNRLAFEQGNFQQLTGGISQIGAAVQNFQGQQAAQQAAESGDSGGFSAGGAATGALGGAATGAQIGSVVPGIGTAVGAIGGAIVGAAGGGLQ